MSAAAVKAVLSGIRLQQLPGAEISLPGEGGLTPSENEDDEWPTEWTDEDFEAFLKVDWTKALAERDRVRLIWSRSIRQPVMRRDISRSLQAPTEAEERAAERLGVPPAYLKAAAGALWDRDFEEERDARAGGGDVSPQTVQGRRGHATRAMLSELREYLGQFGLAGGEPSQTEGGGDE